MRPLFLVAAAAWLASCGSEPAHKPAPVAQKPVAVQTTAAAETELPSTYEATGTVRARTSAVISSKLMGYAREVRAQVGDHVREGQVLVVLDARELDSGLRRAQSAREEWKAALPEADSAIAAAQSQLELAEVTFRRMEELLRKRSITNQEFDDASARRKAAQASLDMARARRNQLNARLAQAEQEIEAARVQQGYAQITAPFAGVILTRSVEPGSLAVPGAPLFTIEREGSFRLEATVEESKLAMARTGSAVTVAIDGLDRTFAARVSEVVPSVDPAARAGTVKIDLPAMAGLRSGLFGRAQFATGTRKALTVPPGAVIERGQLQSVFAVEGNVARVRLVTIGARTAGGAEVLSGLAAGERVVSPVPAGLTDGAPVEVRP